VYNATAIVEQSAWKGATARRCSAVKQIIRDRQLQCQA